MNRFPQITKEERGRRDKILGELQRKLFANGLQVFIIKKAVGGSIYLRFEDQRMGKIRIGDHNERERYGYRWQIRVDSVEPHTTDEKGHKQYFYPATHLDDAIRHMVNYWRVITRNTENIPI